MTSLVDLLAPGPAHRGSIYGVVTGLVTNNQDPDKLGRVKVKFPWLSDIDESWWARVAAPMAGKGRGVAFLPEVNDEVLVAFEHGDPRFPYVLGALWNGNDSPVVDNADGKNDLRVIKSRSGHTITLDDKDGEEKISIVDKSGKNSIVVACSDNTITIAADADISLTSANGKLKLSGNGIELSSQADVKVKASQALQLEASGKTTVKGATIELN